KRRLEFAEDYAKSAETYALAFDYLKAAEDYRKAFEQVERWDADAAWEYKGQEARALLDQGDFSGDSAFLPHAIDDYEKTLDFVAGEKQQVQWAATENNLATTLSILGEREAGTVSLDRSVEAYQASLSVYTREAYPDDWASTYGNLGTVYWRLGQREKGNQR